MGRGTRTSHAAASADVRAMLRPAVQPTRAGWIREHEIEGAAAAIRTGDYTAVDELAQRLIDKQPAPEHLPSLYVDAAAELLERVERDPDSHEAALRYAHALKHSSAAGHATACSGLIRALSAQAVDDVTAAPIAPRQIISDMLWRSGASASTNAVHEEAVQVERQAKEQLTHRALENVLSVPAGVPVTFSTLQSAAQDELAKRTAAALHSRLARTPVMFGVWIRRKPGQRLPSVDQLHQALTAAAAIDDRADAVEAFRRALSDLVR